MAVITRHELEGAAFGVTSGVITTLAVLIGVNLATASKFATIAAILTVAVADALSDAAGIYAAKEAERDVSVKQIWLATLTSFLGKFIFSLIFVIPFIIFAAVTAILVSVLFAAIVLFTMGAFVAARRGKRRLQSAVEHSLVGLGVAFLSYMLGILLSNLR